MMRSVSDPSIGTGTGTVGTGITGRPSGLIIDSKNTTNTYRGKWLWEGKFGIFIQKCVMAPWNNWWQLLIVLIITYKYIVHLLLAYYLENTNAFLTVTFIFGEVLFSCDVIIHLLHEFWPILRLHMRVYKRNYLLLAYDVISITPLNLIFRYRNMKYRGLLIGRWLGIGRIYRLVVFFQSINETMRTSRKKLYFVEHIITLLLLLHAATCFWYYLHLPTTNTKTYDFFAHVVGTQKLNFDNYITCCYYCTCRVFNCIFGDSFPMNDQAKWFTAFLMIVGYVFMRYRFIGAFTWWLVLDNCRWAMFAEQYHHMIQFLKFRSAPSILIEQAKQYKTQLWKMKDGILTTRHLQELPLPMQMELIFDINVRSFHDSLLLRDTDESFMRHISLLMRHEIYLAGQYVWNQGVVKNGMLCIKRGVLEMLSDEDDESPMIAFKKGTVLGEINLFLSIPSKVTVRAATYVELQILRRTDFLRAMTEYPYMLQQIHAKVDARINSSKIRQKAIEKYDRDDSRLIKTRYRPMKILKEHLTGTEEEDPTFVDDSHMYYKDDDNVIRRKFTTQYLDLYQISSKVTTIEEPRICLRSSFPWILEPNTDLLKVFDVTHFIMVLYICFTCPHFSANQNLPTSEKILNTIVNAGLIFNIYTQVTTAVVNKNVRKETVRDIVEEKMATIWFYLDVISVFPMYIFTDTLDPHKKSMATQIVVMLPLLQVWHIWDYLEKWQANFYSNAKLICLTKYLLIFLILCYWAGFILYFYSCPKNLCNEDSWMAKLIYLETKVFITNDARHESPTTTSLSLGTAMITGSGTSNASPGTGDLTLVMLFIILGAYISCFYVAKVCSLYLLTSQRKQKFKDSMRELFYFLSVNHVSGKIKDRVKKFFSVQWYYNNAVSTEEIFNDMSSNIQQEILALEMIDTLLCCPLFQECSKDFLQTLASKSRSTVLPDNEIVQHAADIGRNMYILTKGYCNKLNQHGKVESSIGPGSNIGVIEMLYGLPKVHTILTCTNCILLHIEYSSLVQCWSTFPEISQPIFKVIQSPEIRNKTSKFIHGKPLIGKIDTKTNKFSREIKESFVVLNSRRDRAQYLSTFKKLGVLRYLRYIFIPGCITPHGLFLKLWCTLRFILALHYVLIVPYDIAIKRSKNGGGYNWPDIILYIDIIVMSYIAYYDDKSLLITHPFLTTMRYLKHAFLLDIISILPFEELFKIINEHADTELYRLNRIMLVFRITGAFSYWESDIMRVNQAVTLLKFLPIAITLVNFTTALIFMNSCITYTVPTTSFIMVNCTRILTLSSGSLKLKYAVSEYIYTFYWVFELFVGCGCTPVVGSSRSDIILTMTLQILGLLYFAFMFGYIASNGTASSHSLLDHNEKSQDLENFLYQQNVEPILTAKTLKYFEYVWKRTHGSNPQKICRGLNSALMEDTLVFMYERALREVPLFGKVERSFIRVITQHLQEMYFLRGDTVVKYKDVQGNIYIIYRGKVDVLSSYNEMITCMGPGGMFGNFNGQSVSCSEVTIVASRNLDLLVLPAQTFFNLVKYYPKIQEPLEKAFEVSNDYILPISMDIDNDSSSDSSDFDLLSQDSAHDSRTGSNRYDTGQLSSSRSSSNMSQAKSSASVTTYHSYLDVNNLLKPGSKLYLGYGYLTCAVATSNYVLALYELVTLNDCFIIFWLQSFCDVFFYVKIYLSMHQGYLNRHGVLIIDSSKCRARYYRNKYWKWMDLLANFPLELFGFCFQKPVTAIHYLRANRLFRLKYLIEFYRTTSAELTNNLTTLQTAMSIFAVVLLLHTFTCFWLITITAISPFNLVRTVKQLVLDDDTPQRQWDYTTSFYIIVAELTTTGGDEYILEFLAPMIVLAISLVCGKLLAATVITTSMQVEFSSKYALNNYEKTTGQLMDVLKNQGLSSYQLMKFCTYIRQLWITERGRQLPALLSKTPYVLRCDLMSAMFGHHLSNCFLFADTGHSFLRQLTTLLEYSVFFSGNYIVMAGDSEARMHWVASGVVSVVSVRADLTETTHEQLGTGDVFGVLQGLNRGVTHCFSYRAQTKVSILTLSLDSWINLLSYFPNAKRIIEEKSQKLITSI